MGMVGSTINCSVGFKPAASLVATAAVALPSTGGSLFNSADVTRWQQNIATGPFLVANDYATGSPGDWTRIKNNAAAFLTYGEDVVSGSYAPYGYKARDAAFYYRVTSTSSYLTAVRNYLVATAANGAFDFTSLCYRDLTGVAPQDAYYSQAIWFLRFIATYDFARTGLSGTDRLTIENYIRRQAYFFAAHLDWSQSMIFPNRLSGDYSARLRDAAATGSAAYLSKRYDTNYDGYVNTLDSTTSYPVYLYVNADGSVGPQVSMLSQWFNNRKSAVAAAYGAAGAVLQDQVLVNRAKRYVMEWLTYSVWSDGSTGEYARNGEYAIPTQGLVYDKSNLEGATMLSTWFSKQATPDMDLVNFSTTDGLFGTASATPKNVELVVSTHLQLINKQVMRYFYEGWLGLSQSPREFTRLGKMDSRYMNGTAVTDNYHELGLLNAKALFPNQPIQGLVTRSASVTTLAFPGSTGNGVATGNTQWSDVFGVMPAGLLLR